MTQMTKKKERHCQQNERKKKDLNAYFIN